MYKRHPVCAKAAPPRPCAAGVRNNEWQALTLLYVPGREAEKVGMPFDKPVEPPKVEHTDERTDG
jgi:hypothetical protein